MDKGFIQRRRQSSSLLFIGQSRRKGYKSAYSSIRPAVKQLARQGIDEILSLKKQRRPLSFLLYKFFFYAPPTHDEEELDDDEEVAPVLPALGEGGGGPPVVHQEEHRHQEEDDICNLHPARYNSGIQIH